MGVEKAPEGQLNSLSQNHLPLPAVSPLRSHRDRIFAAQGGDAAGGECFNGHCRPLWTPFSSFTDHRVDRQRIRLTHLAPSAKSLHDQVCSSVSPSWMPYNSMPLGG